MKKWMAVTAAATALLAMSGCATHYVGNGIKEIPVAEMKPVASPKPVQFVFEFQTKSVPNAAVTEYLKQRVTDQVAESKLFAQVSATPVDGGGLLKLTLNNVPISTDAAAQGFVTGLTLGLAGSTVIDGYESTLSYLPAGSESVLTAQAKHALVTTLGAGAAAPEGLTKSASGEEAVFTMVRQITSNVLNDLSQNPAFAGAQ
ncbi:hypothetical protein ACTSKR_02400 [Chitinibacteraceae bacterium HSL-7]